MGKQNRQLSPIVFACRGLTKVEEGRSMEISLTKTGMWGGV